ncbi:bacillithiol system redox-active protein YtxJ [Chryseobacterium sp. A301]
MSLFNLFSSGSNPSFELDARWIALRNEADWKAVLEASKQKKVVVFKHSTACHVSKMVLKNFQREMEEQDKELDFYYLDLLQYRQLSNQIASDLKIIHQSPQLLVIENGVCTENSSHQAISLSLV